MSLLDRKTTAHRLLSAEEERSLVARVNAVDLGKLLPHEEPTSPQRDALVARNILVECNQALVISNAKKYRNCSLPMDDLIQEGNLGLLRAIDEYDPDKGRFTTYATVWICRFMVDAIRGNLTIRLPNYVVTRIWKTKDDNSGLSAAQIAMTNRARASLVRRDSVDGVPLEEAIEVAPTPKPDIEVERNWLRAQESMGVLDDRERFVIRVRFGLDGTPTQTLVEAGTGLGVCKERVRQIESAALKKLHAAMA